MNRKLVTCHLVLRNMMKIAEQEHGEFYCDFLSYPKMFKERVVQQLMEILASL